jgi:hypothetical protein
MVNQPIVPQATASSRDKFNQRLNELGPDARVRFANCFPCLMGPPGTHSEYIGAVFSSPSVLDSLGTIVNEFGKPQSVIVERLQDFKLPLVFERSPLTKPDLFPSVGSLTVPLTWEPPMAERSPDRFVLVSLLASSWNWGNGPVIVDGRVIEGHKYGEADLVCFNLGSADSIGKVNISVKWGFVRLGFIIIQIVTKSSGYRIVEDICKRTGAYEFPGPEAVWNGSGPLMGSGNECHGCKFDVFPWLERVQETGDAFCEKCKRLVVLGTMHLALRPKAMADEDTEMTNGRRAFYSYFYTMHCLPKMEPDWEKLIFGEEPEGGMEEEVAELHYGNAEEFLEALAPYRTDLS